MKIAFYFKNSKYKGIDFSKPQKGNPGVGGVEYMFSLVSYFLADDYETFIFADYIDKLSDKTINYQINSLEDVLNKADLLGIDYLVCRCFGNTNDYKLLDKHNTKIIIWAHNFSKLKEINTINKNKKIVKYVCVGRHQYELLNGHPIYNKSTYINNGLPLNEYVVSKVNNNKDICYIGSIIKGKGFDKCCKIWRKLYDNGYKVQFNIIGTAKLYNSSKKLGIYGIASPDYEKEFIDYLVDNEGNILKDVNLYGVLGHKDKVYVINKSYLGFSASNEETFGLIALEFLALGKPFIAKMTCGYQDIINDKVGILVNDEKELYDACVKMLTIDKEIYDIYSKESIKQSAKYSVSQIINDWKLLFNSLVDGKDYLNRKEKIGLINKIENLYNLASNKH